MLQKIPNLFENASCKNLFLISVGFFRIIVSSQKSTSYPTPVQDSSATSQGSDPVPGSDTGYSGQGQQQSQGQGQQQAQDQGYGYGSQGTGTGSQVGSGETMLQDGSWMAGLAMGDSSRLTGASLAMLLAGFTFVFLFNLS